MLRRLMARDLLLARTSLLANGTVFAAFLAYSARGASSPRAYAFFASLVMFFLPVVLFTREDLAKAAASTCVLPVSRDEVVRARVLVSWLLMTVGLAVAFALGALLPGSRVGGGALFEPGVVFFAATVLALAAALLLPLVVRFGFMGIIAFLVTAQGLGLVLMLVTTWSSGPASRRPLHGVAGRLAATVAAAREAAGPALFSAALAATLCLACYLSYRVCLALFRRKEL